MLLHAQKTFRNNFIDVFQTEFSCCCNCFLLKPFHVPRFSFDVSVILVAQVFLAMESMRILRCANIIATGSRNLFFTDETRYID